MKIIPVLISFFSYGYIQDCLRTFWEYFPNQKVLVIDNNPDEKRKCWQMSYLWRRFPHEATRYVIAEREWLKNQSNVILFKPDVNHILLHGEIIDIANEWCKDNGIDLYLHIEPDCLISGRIWYDNLLSAIIDDQMIFASGSFFNATQSFHLTPSIWRIDAVDTSFAPSPRMQEFHRGVKVSMLHHDWQKNNWDTGALFVANCAGLRKSKKVDTPDFKHLWRGSITPHISQILL